MKKHLKNHGLIILLIVIFLIIVLTPSGEKILSEDEISEESIEEDKYTHLREQMVETQLKTRDINDKAVLDAMKNVPRHEFVPENMRKQAYEDHPIPIGYGQTISQPYIVALMTQTLDVDENDNILEIGTGSGYQAAVLGELVEKVYTIEIIEELATSARERLNRLGYENIRVKHADGYFGWEEHAPFDTIIVTAAANHIPPPLLQQLKDGGKLIIPLGSTLRFQTLTLITKVGNETETEFITGVRFVPLTGEAQKK
ncbi:MAG: protein-L-isoaspartate(D-aspartate) O-methyltransferase [Nanoarchaeota archaeon]|nr:protein-L-isoaspartate(D-aspartate) O-methyltransferase [DPANN group archaeon]MBL7117009.1 protein-L-isoaspartate(D-aspartate) O-methyltransferase [Nanoarchaeota archaeon]